MTVHLEARDRALWITLDRPEARNALDWETLEDLGRAFMRVRDDEDVWVGVLTGAGDRAFCVGADLKKLPFQVMEARSQNREMPSSILRDLWCEKPLVCAINGDALGGGLELALACDLRIAASHARLGLPEARWSLIPAGGGTQRLPRVIPAGKALEMMFTGEPVSAPAALELGLVNSVVELGDLQTAATDLVDRICRCGPLAVRAIKSVVHRGSDLTMERGLELEIEAMEKLQGAEDFMEGPMAFMQKRAPQWKAR